MFATIRSRRCGLSRIGLVWVVVLAVFAPIPAIAEVPTDEPPAPLAVPVPEMVVLRVDVPVVSEKGGSVTSVGITAAFPDGSGVLPEDVAVTVSVGGGGGDLAAGSADGSGADYVSVEDFEVVIPAGESSATAAEGFVLSVTDDDLAEGFETLTVAGSTTATGIERVSGAVITIVDDDGAVALAVDSDPGEGVSSRAAEGVTTLVEASAELAEGVVAERDLAVSVSVGAEGDVAVGSADGTGADYAKADDFEIIIPAGKSNAVRSFELAVSDDDWAEGDEDLTVGGSGEGLAVIGASLTIVDNDGAVALAVDSDPGEGVSSRVEEGVTTQVEASAELAEGVVAERDVTVSASVGAEGDGATGSADGTGADYKQVDDFEIVIPAGSGRGAGSFSLETTDDDAADEGEESVTVSGTVTSAEGFTATSATIFIVDGDSAGAEEDEKPGLRDTADVVEYQTPSPDKVVLSADVSEAEEGAAAAPTVKVTAAFPDGTATLSSAVTVSVSVGKSGDTATGSADGSVADYTAVADFNLEIPAGSSSVTQTTGFTLTVTDDALAEGDETLTITGSTSAVGITAVEETIITITDDADSAITLTVDTDPGPGASDEVTEEGRDPSSNPGRTLLSVAADLPSGITAARDLPVNLGLGAEGDEAVGWGTGEDDYLTISPDRADSWATIAAGESGFAGHSLSFLAFSDDLAGEGRESVTVTGRVLDRSDLSEIAGFSVVSDIIYITDSDQIPDIVLSTSPVRVGEGAGSPSVTITAAYEDSDLDVVAEVTVSVTAGKSGDSATGSADGTGADYATPTISDITIAAREKTGTTTFNLTLTDDADIEGDHSLTFTGSTTTAGVSVAEAVLVIVDDDLITLTLSSSSLGEGSGTTGVTVTAALPSDVVAPSGSVTVSVTVGKSGDSASGSADGTGADYTNLTIPDIVIASGTSSASATAQNVTITQDDLAEGDEVITFTGTATSPYEVADAPLTITDDDATISLSVSPDSVAESNRVTTVAVTGALETGKTAAADLTVAVSVGKAGDTATHSEDGSEADYSTWETDYTITRDFEVKIEQGMAEGSSSFILTVSDDSDWEGDETLTLVGTLDTFTINEPSITITDNDLNPAACGDGTYVDNPATQTGLASDCRALISIRNQWVSNSVNYNWPTNHPVLNWGKGIRTKIGNWDGVVVTDTDPRSSVTTSRVTTFEMLNGIPLHSTPGWQVWGRIPSEIGYLTALEYLWLHNNFLLGEIPPEIGNLSNLKGLLLHNNILWGNLPSQLGSLSNLVYLGLYDNLLRGDIPKELGSLTNLRSLWLEDNFFSGNIPKEIGNLINLKYLELNDNGLTGSIPVELGNLRDLEYLYIHDNALSGAIPSSLGNLTKVKSLNLNNNNLSGKIPNQLGNLAALTFLDLSHNNLTGSIPSSFGLLSNLFSLWLHNNNLSGSLPFSLGNLRYLVNLGLMDNSLTGTIPDQVGNLAPSEGGSLRWLYINNPGPLGPLPEPLLGIHWIDLFAYDDPLDLIAFYEFSKGLGTAPRTYEVWTCDVGDGHNITPQEAVNSLNLQVTPFFKQMSGDKFAPAFRVGGAVTSSVTRAEEGLEASRVNCREQIRPNRGLQGRYRNITRKIIIIDNSVTNGGYNHYYWLLGYQPGTPGYQKLTIDTVIHVGGGSVVGIPGVGGGVPRINTVAHEIGHDLQWPHSFSYGSFTEYDNRMDLMSGRDAYGLTTGTIAVNRYAAGWIDPEDVAVHTGATTSYELSPAGEDGTQMLVIPTRWGPGVFYTLGVRAKEGIDRDVPLEGVEVYLVDQRHIACSNPWVGTCSNLSRRTLPYIASEEDSLSRFTIEHVFDESDDPFGLDVGVNTGEGEAQKLQVRVTGRQGNKFTVSVAGLPFTPVTSRSILGLPERMQVSVTPSGSSRTVQEGESRRVTVTVAYPSGSRTSRYDAEALVSVGGTASPGSDYGRVGDFAITIPAGESRGSRSFTLRVLNDSQREGAETITLSVRAPGYTVSGQQQVTFTIPANDEPRPTPTPGGGGGSPSPPPAPPPSPPPPAQPPPPVVELQVPVQEGRFSDEDGSVHEPSVEMIAGWGITVGCDASDPALFCPSQSITRRQMSAFLYRAVVHRWGTPEAAERAEAEDVGDEAWYRAFADWAVENGVMEVVDGLFNPGGVVTRSDMAVMLVAAFPHLAAVEEAQDLFGDLEGADERVVRAVEGLFGSGVTKGCTDSPLRYCPDQPVTRAQMASFFVRALNQAPPAAAP